MRIGILSGTFDPVHLGHLSVAEAARIRYQLDKIVFLPEEQPRHKPLVTDIQRRLDMLGLALQGSPAYALWRARQAQHNLETIADLQTIYGNARLFMIVGSDVAASMQTWRDYRQLRERVEMIVVGRPGQKAALTHLTLHLPVSSADIRATLAAGRHEHRLPAAVLDYAQQHRLYR